MKTTPPHLRQDLHCVASDLSAQVRERDEQLAALAEQNAKMREALEVANGHLICHLYNYDGSGVHQFLLDTISLPDLATPVLNRIRAEAMKLAAEILDSPMDRAAAQKIIAKAAELEKTNG